MKDLTHERCSEQLGAYASGHLEAPERGEVEAHLGSCQDCSLELAGLRSLLGIEVVPMSGPERDELARAVRAAVFSPQKATFSERFGRRFAPALGAVALLAIATVAVISMPNRTDLPTAGNSGGGDTADVERAEEDTSISAGAPEASTKQSEELAGDSGVGVTAGSQTAESSADSATLSAGAALRTRTTFTVEAASFADTGLNLPALVPPQSPREGIAAYNSATTELSRSAPNEDVAQRIRECVETTIATSPHPLAAASAAYYGDNVLVIGFVWIEPSTTILNYELRGWLDGDCDRVSPIYRRGQVE